MEVIQKLSIILDENKAFTFQNMRMSLTEYATFFKLDGVLGSDSAINGKLIIDYNNRHIEFV